jgi:hypothetical protein
VLHQESDRISAAAATKTFVDFFGRTYRKRRRLFIMKRTKPKVIGAPFLEFNETTDHIDDIDAAKNLLYRMLADQERKNEPAN